MSRNDLEFHLSIPFLQNTINLIICHCFNNRKNTFVPGLCCVHQLTSCPWPQRSRQHNEHPLRFLFLFCAVLSACLLENITIPMLFCFSMTPRMWAFPLVFIQGQTANTCDSDLWWRGTSTRCTRIHSGQLAEALLLCNHTFINTRPTG